MLAKNISIGFIIPLNNQKWGVIDKKGFSTAHLAAKFAEIDSLKFLHMCNPKMIATPNIYGVTPAHIAAANGQVDVLKLFNTIDRSLLKSVSKVGWNLGHFAAQNGHVHVIKFLNKELIDIDKEDINAQTPMLLAHLNNHYDCVSELMFKPISCNIL